MAQLISIHGKKRSGKGVSATYLQEHHGYQLVKFADTLKEMLRTLFRCAGYDDEMIERFIEGDLKETPLDILDGKTPRYAMQTLGTEWRDFICETLWVNIAVMKIKSLLDQGIDVVVDDMRFPHEMRAIKDLNGTIVKVKNNRLIDNEFSTHSSEIELPDDIFDVILENHDTFDYLYGQIENTLFGPLKPHP